MSKIKFTTADILKGVDPYFQPAVERLGLALRAKLQRDYKKVEANQMYGKFNFPNRLTVPMQGLTGSQLAAVSNKAHQRHKGPPGPLREEV